MISPIVSEAGVDARRAGAGEPVIRLEGVTVRYRVPVDRVPSFKEYAVRRLVRRPRFLEHEALHEVSLDVAAGEAVGVIGSNGAGKTTLLRLVARVLTPTAGRVRVRGRVAPVLDVVGGFHPELTGRENIFLNGTLLGLSRRQIAARLEHIADFADLGEFMDAPVRTYSSGMVARLGFSTASDVDADILVIDETLGVGDAHFQLKCAARLDAFRARGATLLLVSHDVGAIMRLCTRVLWLDHGRMRMVGKAEEVVRAYLDEQQK